jgi:hypothetical protein
MCESPLPHKSKKDVVAVSFIKHLLVVLTQKTMKLAHIDRPLETPGVDECAPFCSN